MLSPQIRPLHPQGGPIALLNAGVDVACADFCDNYPVYPFEVNTLESASSVYDVLLTEYQTRFLHSRCKRWTMFDLH